MKGLGQKGGKYQKVEGCHKKKKDIVHRTNVFNQHNVNTCSSKVKVFKGLNFIVFILTLIVCPTNFMS